ncbi:MAG: PIN domain-containing protein [Oscillospiraceae bacterium]|nr:PIN domain-containing protein [Oscillospiraceae bacterium]
MLVIDANVILRLILNDNDKMVGEAKAVIRSKQVLIKNEVLAEVIYVLLRVYKISKAEICKSVIKLIDVENVLVESKEIIKCAVDTFESGNLDFVDCLLFAYHSIERREIFTFDKKLKALMQ